MSVRVLRPGALSSFQDLGRFGSQHLGVPVGGAMDARAHRLANMLVGNTADTATLEITLTGPTLQFEAASCLAICGADLDARINAQPAPLCRPLVVRAGDTLSFGLRRQGVRAYVAWHGGPAIAPVLDSASTCLGAGFGGLEGRALSSGDQFALRRALDPTRLGPLEAMVRDLRLYLPVGIAAATRKTLRVLRHAQAELFTPLAWERLTSNAFRIDAASNRMGYRLEGPELPLRRPASLLSEAVSPGTIQIPPDGRPIVLMADRQTTGGYAKLGTVITADLPLIAQHMSGQTLRFQACTLEDAHDALLRREAAFGQLLGQTEALREALRVARLLQE